MPFRRPRPRKVALLDKLPLFAGLSPRELSRIAALVDEVDIPAGTRLTTIGHLGQEMCVIVDGSAQVITRGGRRARLGSGDFFGEMSLIDGEPRSATVETITPMHLLVLGHSQFQRLLRESPAVTGKIMRVLSKRLREAERSPVA